MRITGRRQIPQLRARFQQEPNTLVRPRMQRQVRMSGTNSNMRQQRPGRQQVTRLRQLRTQLTRQFQQMRQLNNRLQVRQPRHENPQRVRPSSPQLQQQPHPNNRSNQAAAPRVNQANCLTETNRRPLQERPSYISSSRIKKILECSPDCDYSNSVRMLILLANGEQRLVTFTIMNEACTIHEILEQVNIPFQSDTKIEIIETNSNGINYIVAVGHVQNFKRIIRNFSRSVQLPNNALTVRLSKSNFFFSNKARK